MKSTNFLNEGTNAFCPKCDCNTSTGDGGKCKLCGELKQVTEAKKEFTVYCSQCGGEFRRSNKNGFSHCKDHKGMKNYDLDEEGGRWEYNNDGTAREIPASQAAAHAKANLARMNKNRNPFDDDEYGNHQKRSKDEYGNVKESFPFDVDHMPGPTVRNTLPKPCLHCNGNGKVYAGAKESPWINPGTKTKSYKRIPCPKCNGLGFQKKTNENTSSSCIAVAPSGKTGPSGPAGSLFGGPQRRVKEEKTPSSTFCVSDKKGYVVYTGTKESTQNYVRKNPGKGLKVKNIPRAGAKKATIKEGWENYYSSVDELISEIFSLVQEKYNGKAWFKGGSYAYMIDVTKPNRLVASDGSVIRVKNIIDGLNDFCDRGVVDDFIDSDPSYWDEFLRPVKSQPRNNQADHETANMQGESKQSSILSGIMLSEYSTAAQRAEADRSYQEFVAKGGQPKPAPNKKYKEPSPGTGCGGTRVAGRGEAARGGGSGKPGLKSRTGKAAHNPIARPKIVGEDGQLNEYKPKIIPKTLAGGKLNPNHPSNTAAIASEKEAKYKRQEQARQNRRALTTHKKEQSAKERELEKARAKIDKKRRSLGSSAPTTPLEKKAKDAMWRVWNAIAPDAIGAMKYGGYSAEDEAQLEDPFYVAEVCCDANHLQTFAELSPEEESEILDNLDSTTLARLAADFGV